MWDSSMKAPNPTSQGRKRVDADEWGKIPDIIKKANIIANQVDYHENFTNKFLKIYLKTLYFSC